MTTTNWHRAWQQRRNEENLAAQAEPVKAAAKEILKELQQSEGCLYWSMDPEESDGGQQWATSLIEHAHALLDLAHEYRAALKANPPPQKVEDDEAQTCG